MTHERRKLGLISYMTNCHLIVCFVKSFKIPWKLKICYIWRYLGLGYVFFSEIFPHTFIMFQKGLRFFWCPKKCFFTVKNNIYFFHLLKKHFCGHYVVRKTACLTDQCPLNIRTALSVNLICAWFAIKRIMRFDPIDLKIAWSCWS